MRQGILGGARRVSMLAVAGAALALTALTPAPAQAQWSEVADGYPQTAAEQASFERHTRHLEMWDYLRALRAVAPNMRLGNYGETREGRKLAYAVFGNPLVTEPWEARALGRPVVVLAANVHGGERTFREGLLVLMRDFATPGTEAYALLDRVTVVVAPQINPDGFEASEQGQRGNSWGIDMNRDYVKLEQPSIINYVTNIIREWRPQIFVDGHNGGSRPYNLNYQCPSHVDSSTAITLLCDQEIFPAIDARLAAEGLKSWYYASGTEEEWRVGGSQARIGRNYGGFVNSVGILFESPTQTLAVGARAGYLGYLAVVEYASNNAERVMDVVAEATRETIAMGAAPSGEVTIEMRYEAENYAVSYEFVPNGGRGTDPTEPVEAVRIDDGRLMKRPVPVRTRPRPWAYLLPRDAVAAVATLRRHGITVERLDQTVHLHVDAYTVAAVTHERAYNHAAATKVEVGEVVTLDRDFPTGTYVVPMAQSLGRLAAHMLEVETEDNVVYWNTMDAWLPRTADAMPRAFGPRNQTESPPLVPIYKLMNSVTLPTSLVR